MSETKTSVKRAQEHISLALVSALLSMLIADQEAKQSAFNMKLIYPDTCELVANVSLDDVAATCKK